jgi:uncharacterized caspase-like protein
MLVVLQLATGGELSPFFHPAIHHGVFTSALLKGLQGEADIMPVDKRIDVLELALYVDNTVKSLTHNAQIPELGFFGLPNFTIGLVR